MPRVVLQPIADRLDEAVGAAVRYFRSEGASRVYIIENSTQSNFTRMVFKASGLLKVIKENGATPVYLDEGRQETLTMPTLGREVRVSRWVKERLIDGKDSNLYVSFPKLKTHSMSTVTLSVKNQMAFLAHADRIPDHNLKLHLKLADIYGLVRPDFALIDGVHAVFHGHYPAEALAPRCTERLDLLIGGDDPVATDVVAARLLGFDIEQVGHLREAAARGYGEGDIAKIEVLGDAERWQRHYSCEILPEFPPDVRILQGQERCCPEGCRNNTLTLLQMLWLDFQGKGGFTILMGKGHDAGEVDSLTGRTLLVGDCAIEELAPRLMKVSPLKMVPLNPLDSAWTLMQARLHRTTSRIPPLAPR